MKFSSILSKDLFKNLFFILICLFSSFSFEEKALASTTIEELVTYAQEYFAYEQSNRDLCNPAYLREVMPEEQVPIFLELNKGAYEDHVGFALQLLNIVNKFKRGEIGKNKLLRELLKIRFDFLKERVASVAQECLHCDTDSDLVLHVSTYPEIFQAYDQNGFNHRQAQSTNARYQHLSYMIYIALHIRNGEKLTLVTQRQLNCSTAIHLFLLGETCNPGFPDFAAYELEQNRHPTDIDYFDEYIEHNFETTLISKTLGAPKEPMRVLMLRSEARIIAPLQLMN